MSKHCKPNFTELSLETLRSAGYRITKQRRAVIDCIAKAKKPLSAPNIYKELSKHSKGAPLDNTSVYRVLGTLLENDLVHRVSPSGEYIACNHQHCVNSHHIMSRCIKCNKVEELDVPQEVVAPLLFHMRKALSFTPDSHLLHMDGHCSSCSGS